MSQPRPEFSRRIAVGLIGPQEQEHRLQASGEERQALARRFGLVELVSLEAAVRLSRPSPGGLIRLEAELRAEVVQSCVVTLEPLTSRLQDRIVLHFGLAGGPAGEEAGEVELSIEEDDPPEPIVDGEIDMGEAVVQGLALALDPYPRKPGAEAEDLGAERPAADGSGPFAALARLRKKE
jgi:hypothetical protein